MRCVAAFALLLIGCEGAPNVPAHLEELGDVPQLPPESPAAFDFDDSLVFMDPSTGLRRFADGRLLQVSGGQNFTNGAICVDHDGTLLIGTFSSLSRLEPGETFVQIQPGPPTSFTRCTGTPNHAYHILPFGSATTLTLFRDGESWFDSMRLLDRTLRAPNGTFYAIENGDVVTLAPDDSAQIVASCAEFAGGTCPDLELVGVDGSGGVHMAIAGLPDLHVLDPSSGSYRDIALPGGLEIQAVATGVQYALVLAVDPDRNNELSLWMLPDGGDQFLRFAAVGSLDVSFIRLLVDHAGNGFVMANSTLQAVVLE